MSPRPDVDAALSLATVAQRYANGTASGTDVYEAWMAFRDATARLAIKSVLPLSDA
jgi:hypothetical protein